MGCDIHMYVEKKIKGKWIPAQGMVKGEDGILDVPYPDRFYRGRNYTLFGVLTNGGVRHEVKTPFKVKGFPKNASKEVKAIFKRWGSDAHTPSYLTLAQLESINWKNWTVKESGIMGNKQADKFEEELKKPLDERNWNLRFPYCQGTTMKDVRWVKWEIPLSVTCEDFFNKLWMLSCYDYRCKHTEIRIVFWFDN